VPDPSLATILQAAGKTFTGYVEHPNASYDHNPWESFPEGLSVEKDFSTFPTANFAALPTVSFVIPNVYDDMHTGTIAQGDAWLQTNINSYAQWAKANNSLLVVTWDENDGSSGNHVATILYGADVNQGTYSTPYNHYNLLSTVLAASTLTGPTNAALATVIGGGVFGPVCFAAGTRIVTARGEIPVEDLAENDSVVTLRGDERALRPVKWVGNRRLDVAAHPRPWLVAPVRIRHGAFAENVPARDLVLSPDHCVFAGGMLIPVKSLINGMTIIQERDARFVHYYHVELDRHAVLLAEGMPVESYLDTGNRAFFANAGRTLVLHPEFEVNAGLRCWQEDACAPLVTRGADVERLWRRLTDRAALLGHALAHSPGHTEDADLRLVAGNRTIRPIATDGGRHVFVLPAVPTVRVVSSAFVPSELEPYLDDWRRLGVAIRRVVIRSEDGETVIGADHPSLADGWHEAERDGVTLWRWTDGDALLPIPAKGRAITLEIDVAHMRPQRAGSVRHAQRVAG
jgi:hypothetical protein